MRTAPLAAGLLCLGLALAATLVTLAQDAKPRRQTGDGVKQRLLEEELAQKLALEEKTEQEKPGRQGGGPAVRAAVEWVFSEPAGIELTRSEVTVAQYRKCVAAGKCDPRAQMGAVRQCNSGVAGRDNHPINCIDWHQASAFCAWAGGRLPTEEEWYAEASDRGKRQFPWGDQEPNCERAILGLNSEGCGRNSTWPVCSKATGNSVSGLCDLAGNVWEWTSSSSSKGKKRVLLGGSWRDDEPICQFAAHRLGYAPTNRHDVFGFRCVRSAAHAP